MTSTNQSTLKTLRAVVPHRATSFDEALQVAELQATKLYELIGLPEGIQEFHLAQLPRVRVVHESGLTVSGMSHWNGSAWIITLNAGDPPTRQRFTMLHEFKHILDHGYRESLYQGANGKTRAEQAEAAADYFAGCALLPKRFLKSMWGRGMQSSRALAAHFGASEQAVRVRLAQTGLDAARDSQPAPRCARPVSTPRAHRQRFYPLHRTYARRKLA